MEGNVDFMYMYFGKQRQGFHVVPNTHLVSELAALFGRAVGKIKTHLGCAKIQLNAFNLGVAYNRIP